MSNYKIIETVGDASSIVETDDVEFAKWYLTLSVNIDVEEIVDALNDAAKDGHKLKIN